MFSSFLLHLVLVRIFLLINLSISILEGLYRDTISHAVQEGVGEDYGFLIPEKVAYEQIIHQVKVTAQEISTSSSFRQKWKTATALPATLFFLSGMNAYAQESSDNIKEALRKDYIGAGVTAATTAGTIADDTNEFITTWFTTFTTLV